LASSKILEQGDGRVTGLSFGPDEVFLEAAPMIILIQIQIISDLMYRE
jgi:hypothetical protein